MAGVSGTLEGDALAGVLEALVGQGIVGAAAAVRRHGAPMQQSARGLADRVAGTPMAPWHRFRVASISKSFIAALVLKLAEEGVLSLDDPLANWMPERPFAQEITLRHILTHTGGLPTYSLYAPAAFPRIDAGAPKTVYIGHAYARTPPSRPEERFQYANVGSRILGVIVERATGRSLAEQIQARFLSRLGLDESLPSGWRGPLPATLARGYDHGREGRPPDDVTARVPWQYLWSGGDMVSTAGDLARWMEALFEGQVLSQEMTRAATEVLVPGEFAGSALSHHGLVAMVFTRGSHRVFGYRGSTPGYVGIAGYVPASGVSIALLTNSYSADPHAFERTGVETAMFSLLDRLKEPL